MQHRILAIFKPLLAMNHRGASLSMLPALLLAGCGSSPSPNADLEARIAAVEKKAEQAEVRSKEALSMAASGGSSSSSGGAQPEEFAEDVMPDEEPFNDNPSSGNQMIPPPPPGPPGAPGGPSGPMMPGG